MSAEECEGYGGGKCNVLDCLDPLHHDLQEKNRKLCPVISNTF